MPRSRRPRAVTAILLVACAGWLGCDGILGISAGTFTALDASPADASGADVTDDRTVPDARDDASIPIDAGDAGEKPGRVLRASLGGVSNCAIVRPPDGLLDGAVLPENAGEVWCWGLNSSGDHISAYPGDDASTPTGTPKRIPGVPPATAISVASVGAGCAVTVGGSLYCWGTNNAAETGRGDYDFSTLGAVLPAPVQFGEAGTPTAKFVEVRAGYAQACAVTQDKELYCWGLNLAGETGFTPIFGFPPDAAAYNSPPDIVPFATHAGGADHVAGFGLVEATCKILQNSVECFGSDRLGILGRAVSTQCPSGGGLAPCDPTPAIVDQNPLSNATHLLLGANLEPCIVRSDGVIPCWGSGSYGFDLGDTMDAATFVRPHEKGFQLDASFDPAFPGDVDERGEAICVVTPARRVLCRGVTSFGVLGPAFDDGGTALEGRSRGWYEVPLPGRAAAIYTNLNLAGAITEDAKLYVWGAGTYGALGFDPAAGCPSPATVRGNDAVDLDPTGPTCSSAVPLLMHFGP